MLHILTHHQERKPDVQRAASGLPGLGTREAVSVPLKPFAGCFWKPVHLVLGMLFQIRA